MSDGKLRTPHGRPLAAAAAMAILASAGGARAAQTDQDARFDKVERELQAVGAELAALKAERAAQAPVSRTEPSSGAPSSASTATNPGFPSLAGIGPTGQAGQIAPSTPTSAATAAINGGHPGIQSGDGAFTANLLGVMQWDVAQYDQRTPGPTGVDLRRGAAATDTAHARDLSSGSDFRRARIGIGGKAFGDFEYNILYDFGGSGEEDAGHIQELWVQYSGFKPFHARVGAFPPFMGLEDAGSTNGMPLPERPAITDIARSLAGGDFREGAQLTANTDRWFVSAAVTGRLVGVVNSTGSGVTQPYDSQLGYTGRVAVVPFKGKDYLLHLGIHGSYVQTPADTGGPDTAVTAARYPLELRERPELRVDGTRLIDTGAIDSKHGDTLGFEAAAEWKSLFLQGEYEMIDLQRRNPTNVAGLSDPHFSGWYVEGTWLLTGEARRYNPGNFAFDAPPVRHNFSPRNGGWGAFELALRYSDADLNYHQGVQGAAPAVDAVRGGDQRIFTAGLNWYLNPIVRFMFDYQHVDVSRLSPNAVTFATPMGAQIGQAYDALIVRSQLAF